jgi:alpha-1,2-mannosyltransferase
MQAMHELFEAHPEYRTGEEKVELVLIGGCRDRGDERRVEELKKLAKELKIEVGVLSLLWQMRKLMVVVGQR